MEDYRDVFFKDIDFKEDDQIYFIRVRKIETGVNISRRNHGFNPFELIGLLEDTRLDIAQQLKGNIKPTIIDREVIK